MHHLEVQIEVVCGNDAERVRTRVEQAIYHALSLRPTVTVAKPGAFAHFELRPGASGGSTELAKISSPNRAVSLPIKSPSKMPRDAGLTSMFQAYEQPFSF